MLPVWLVHQFWSWLSCRLTRCHLTDNLGSDDSIRQQDPTKALNKGVSFTVWTRLLSRNALPFCAMLASTCLSSIRPNFLSNASLLRRLWMILSCLSCFLRSDAFALYPLSNEVLQRARLVVSLPLYLSHRGTQWAKREMSALCWFRVSYAWQLSLIMNFGLHLIYSYKADWNKPP